MDTTEEHSELERVNNFAKSKGLPEVDVIGMDNVNLIAVAFVDAQWNAQTSKHDLERKCV